MDAVLAMLRLNRSKRNSECGWRKAARAKSRSFRLDLAKASGNRKTCKAGLVWIREDMSYFDCMNNKKTDLCPQATALHPAIDSNYRAAFKYMLIFRQTFGKKSTRRPALYLGETISDSRCLFNHSGFFAAKVLALSAQIPFALINAGY